MAEFRPVGEMASTMQDFPLTITHLFRHGAAVHGRSEVVNFDGERLSAVSFADVAQRVELLAAALASLGVGRGERVATLMWNSQEHLEAYFAVPCMGAVLHTLNLRLAPADLARIMAEAGDQILLVHDSLMPLASAVVSQVPTLEHVVVAADPGQPSSPPSPPSLGGAIQCHSYEELLAAQEPGYEWPEIEERPSAIRVVPLAPREGSSTATVRLSCTPCLSRPVRSWASAPARGSYR
jgi:fatty-acyl-CoA synthase